MDGQLRRTALLVLFAIGTIYTLTQNLAYAQNPSCPASESARQGRVFAASECGTAGLASLETIALSDVDRRNVGSDTISLTNRAAAAGSTTPRLIVIGFVGGFVRRDDEKHPEVQFAEYLQNRYHSGVHAEVFGNHHGKMAMREVLQLLDAKGDGTLTPDEKSQARIVIFGHSWGATETLVFARELQTRGIPVLLTIQMDTIGKPLRNHSVVPPNVASAINFFQTHGPLHGHAQILAADPARTTIIGNFKMTYEDYPVNCDNYPWYARKFNKPHHELENDPRVWAYAAELIDSAFTKETSSAQLEASSQPH